MLSCARSGTRSLVLLRSPQQVILPNFIGKNNASYRFASTQPPPPGRKRGVLGKFVGLFAVGPHINRILRKSSVLDDDDMINLISTAGALSVYSFAAVTVLNHYGVDTTPFVAGFSVAGAAVGFGLKDIAHNYVTGILMLLNRTFEKNARVTVGGTFTGRVIQVDLRHVVLQNDQGKVFVPNSLVFSNPIIVHKD
eukprot:c3306_g1_i2.p2 GENE.c3306_g1_i2~~c3306_g1_i2.p2  ORF type:complete len:195 (+),score=33.78 c3306_g1_i2:1266-1850(+)